MAVMAKSGSETRSATTRATSRGDAVTSRQPWAPTLSELRPMLLCERKTIPRGPGLALRDQVRRVSAAGNHRRRAAAEAPQLVATHPPGLLDLGSFGDGSGQYDHALSLGP